MTQLLKACANSREPILREISQGLLDRRLFKCIEGTSERALLKEYERRLSVANLDPEFFFAEDKPSDLPYKPYDPYEENQDSLILVEDQTGKPRDLAALSEPVAQLSKTYGNFRLYFPEIIRQNSEQKANKNGNENN